MTYSVRLEQFEGPLELLLSLIEKEKLDITRVSLAKVADQYIEYLRAQSSIPLGSLAQFLSIASRLLLLKSRALLPLLTFTDEEEAAIVDLEWQLREYRKFREVSQILGKQLLTPMAARVRERAFHSNEGVFFPPSDLSVETLHLAFESVLGEIPILEKLDEVELAQVVRLEEKMVHFREHLMQRMETSFEELTARVENRVELIVSFLALLQLIKERFITADQEHYFGSIAVKRSQSTDV